MATLFYTEMIKSVHDAISNLIAGIANTRWEVIDPESKDKFYKWIEKISDVGKGISKGWDNVKIWFKGSPFYG